MSHHPLYRKQSPQWFRANIFLLGLYTWQSTLQSETCPLRIFKKGNCAAARALYRKKNAAEHFIESISFERGPRGERCLGRAARPCLQIEALLARARARGAPRAPFTMRTPFKGNLILCWTGHFIPWPLFDTSITIWMFGISLYSHGTLYNVGFWLYRQNMLAFHFIDANHVAIPVYTRLLSIKSAAKHLASCTWGILCKCFENP